MQQSHYFFCFVFIFFAVIAYVAALRKVTSQIIFSLMLMLIYLAIKYNFQVLFINSSNPTKTQTWDFLPPHRGSPQHF